MALEDIFRALERQADSDVADVLAEARARAAGLVAEADIEAEAIRERHAAEAEAAASSSTTRTLNSARLEARRALAAVRQRAVGDVIDTARQSLGTVRESTDYEDLFARLLAEALEGVSGEIEVLVDPRDAELARAQLAHRDLAGTIKPNLDTAGGVVVSTHGGRIFRRNTLEDRFEKLSGLAQADVARILFS